MNKISVKALLVSLLCLSSCAVYKGRPRAINKPKKLVQEKVKRTAPIYEVQKENVDFEETT